MQSAIERERDSRREACWSSRCHDWTHIQTHSFRHTHSDTHITAQTPCVCRWLDTHSDTLTFRHTHTFRHTPECANTLWGIWRLTIVTWYALLCATFIICGTLHSYVTYDCCFWLDLLCVLHSWLSKRHMFCRSINHLFVNCASTRHVFCFIDTQHIMWFALLKLKTPYVLPYQHSKLHMFALLQLKTLYVLPYEHSKLYMFCLINILNSICFDLLTLKTPNDWPY